MRWRRRILRIGHLIVVVVVEFASFDISSWSESMSSACSSSSTSSRFLLFRRVRSWYRVTPRLLRMRTSLPWASLGQIAHGVAHTKT